MADAVEVLDPDETLYTTARLWEWAGDEWDTAAQHLPRASVSGGVAHDPVTEDFARAYHDCLYELRGKLVDGATALYSAARALRRSAEEYVTVDDELDRRIARMVAELAGWDCPEGSG